jgi:hypothetical protein
MRPRWSRPPCSNASRETAEILGREQGYDVHVFDNEQRARIWLNYGGY